MIITEQNRNIRADEQGKVRAQSAVPQIPNRDGNSEIRQPRRESGENRAVATANTSNSAGAAARVNTVNRSDASRTPAVQNATSKAQTAPTAANRPASQNVAGSIGQAAVNRTASSAVRRTSVSQTSVNGAPSQKPNAAQKRPTTVASDGNAPKRVQIAPQTRAGARAPVSAERRAQILAAQRAQNVNVKAGASGYQADQKNKSSLMKAQTMDLSVVRGDRSKNDKKEERYSSGEGGNTVMSIIKAVVYIKFVFVISIFLSYFIIVIGNDVFAFVKSDEAIEVVIPEYATLDNVAEVLYENDVIKYPQIFKLFAVAKNYDGEFLAGTYTVTPMMNYEALLDSFKEKPVRGTIELTIPEGYTTDEIIDLFVSNGIGTREGFVDVIENYEFDYWFINELEENGMSEDRIYRLDGYLFPDTYQFYLESSEQTVINKLLKRFSQIFTKKYREQCEYLGYTVDEVITLASIIEKEAASPAEFFKVSSVFHNRLNNPWSFPKLESDATIVYAIQHETGERPDLKDTSYETPYNTYKYDGLPPGPIANPSASAMLAAIQPQPTSYYFFIANKGVTYFSETKAQHDAYIAQFKAEAQGGQ